MQQTCTQCGTSYSYTNEDLAMLDSLSPAFKSKKELIPPSPFCPRCRQQRRVCWRSERALHKRNCDLCGRHMLSMYEPETNYTVYCPDCFWSDKWNQDASGRAFDFSKTFAEQFNDLLHTAPLMSLTHVNAQNSEYCNRIYGGRNNYLSFIVLFDTESSLYSYYMMKCKDVCDVCTCQHCELCYDVTDGENSHQCFYSTRIRNCSDSYFLEDCIGCRHCYMCKNMVQKEYCIRNKQYSKEEYEKFLIEQPLHKRSEVKKRKAEAREFFLSQPYRATMVLNCENAVGSNIFYMKDSHECYDFYESERMRYCTLGEKSHDCMDCYGFGYGEFCYETISFNNGHHNLFCAESTEASDLLYSFCLLQNSHDCFGCVGLKKRSYCIFNKQYTQEEYEELVPKIIEHMRQTGEWGLYFPPALCPFSYNESAIQEHMPLPPDQARQIGFRWRDRDPREYLPQSITLPDSIDNVKDELTKEVLACQGCGRNYKFVPQELTFYRQFRLPVPDHCHDCRHAARMATRPPRLLWDRTCDNCQKPIKASYPPERPEIVHCEECYLGLIY